jgi:hypothetical protein
MTDPTTPTMTKKLFAVEITYTAYAWAEDEIEAEDLVSDIVDTEEPSIVISEATSNFLGWDLDCCVYHEGSSDVRLREVL